MRVSGGVLRVPSILDSSRTAVRVRTRGTASPTSAILRHTGYSLINRRPGSGLAFFKKTSIPGGILDSAPQSEQQTGVQTLGCPDHATRTPTKARAYSWGFEVCGYRHVPPGDYFPYRIASAILLLDICFVGIFSTYFSIIYSKITFFEIMYKTY